VAQAFALHYHLRQFWKLMGLAEEMMRVDAVMARQAFQRGAVDVPVMAAQGMGVFFVQFQVVHDVLRHGLVHHREDVRVGIVQGVVQIEHPDTTHLVQLQFDGETRRRRATDADSAVARQGGSEEVNAVSPMKWRLELFGLDQRAYAFVGQDFQQQCMFDAAVDDVYGFDTAAGGIQRRADLGQHAAG